MIYKDYEITAERNSWTEFEVLDEGELGEAFMTVCDDEIRYGFRKDHHTSDYSYDSLKDVKREIDRRVETSLLRKTVKENMEYKGWKLSNVYHNGNKVKAEKDGKELYAPKLGIQTGYIMEKIDALENKIK